MLWVIHTQASPSGGRPVRRCPPRRGSRVTRIPWTRSRRRQSVQARRRGSGKAPRRVKRQSVVRDRDVRPITAETDRRRLDELGSPIGYSVGGCWNTNGDLKDGAGAITRKVGCEGETFDRTPDDAAVHRFFLMSASVWPFRALLEKIEGARKALGGPRPNRWGPDGRRWRSVAYFEITGAPRRTVTFADSKLLTRRQAPVGRRPRGLPRST